MQTSQTTAAGRHLTRARYVTREAGVALLWLAAAVLALVGGMSILESTHGHTSPATSLAGAVLVLASGGLASLSLHLAAMRALVVLAIACGADSALGRSALHLLATLAPRAARRAAVAGGLAGSAIALAMGPVHSAPDLAPDSAVSEATLISPSLGLAPGTRLELRESHTSVPESHALIRSAIDAVPLGSPASSTDAELRSALAPSASPDNDSTPDLGPGTESDTDSHATGQETVDVADRSHPLPGLGAAPQDGTTTEGPSLGTWTVQPGDTLWEIAEADLSARTGSTDVDAAQIHEHLAAVIAANPGVEDPDLILPGWSITLPSP